MGLNFSCNSPTFYALVSGVLQTVHFVKQILGVQSTLCALKSCNQSTLMPYHLLLISISFSYVLHNWELGYSFTDLQIEHIAE